LFPFESKHEMGLITLTRSLSTEGKHVGVKKQCVYTHAFSGKSKLNNCISFVLSIRFQKT